VPTMDSLDVTGVDVSSADMAELLDVDFDEWRAEVPSIRQHFAQFGERLPAALHAQLDELESRLG